MGASRPLVYRAPVETGYAHGSDGLSGQAHLLPEHPHGTTAEDAVALMARILAESPEPVTLAPIGPLTNVALLLAAHPHLKPKIGRLVVMGGGLSTGNSTAAAEFNVWSDPEAAYRVLVEEDVPTVLVPIDLTYRCAVDGAWLDTLKAAGPLGATLESFTPDYRAHYTQLLGYDCTVLHDAVAVAEAVQPGILKTETIPVTVLTAPGPGRGATVADRRLGIAEDPAFRAVEVALEADLDALRDFILDRVTR